MLKLLRYLKKTDWLLVVICLVFLGASAFVELLLPDYMSEITTLVQTEGSEMSEIWKYGGLMLACAFGCLGLTVIVSILSAIFGASLTKTLRSKFYAKVQEMSEEDIENFSTSSLVTRITNDVNQITMFFVMAVSFILKAPIMAGIAIFKIVGSGTLSWTLATGSAVGITIVFIASVAVLVVPKFNKMQSLIDDLNASARENINGVRVIKAFNAESYAEKKFDSANESITKVNVFTQLWLGLFNPVFSLILNGLTLAIYWIGAYSIHIAETSEKVALFSDMMVYSVYAMEIIMSFLYMILALIMLPRAIIAGKRINEVLDKPSSFVEGSFEGETEEKGAIVFEHVDFGYPNADKTEEENVLSDISFSLKQGETLAIIGPTGSGKSTLVDLALRYYDPLKGRVLLDGVDLREYRFESLYDKIALVPQKAILFNASIEENILYGESSGHGDTSLYDAISVSHSDEFIRKKDKGLDEEIEQGGKNVSGGQKQRLSIARALSRKPEVIVFDDSFSALDYKTDLAVREALKKKYPHVTKIIVAQRIGTIKDADQIIVLDEGKIVGKGKHRELLENCPLYREIALSQLSEEELS